MPRFIVLIISLASVCYLSCLAQINSSGDVGNQNSNDVDGRQKNGGFVREIRPGEVIEQIDLTYHPGPVKLDNGQLCKYANDCESDCCVEMNRTRICHPLAKLGEECDESQLKGGYYDRLCPCQRGLGYCNSSGVCV